jgi:hypothetical protein
LIDIKVKPISISGILCPKCGIYGKYVFQCSVINTAKTS